MEKKKGEKRASRQQRRVNTAERIDISCRISMMSMPSLGVASQITQEAIHGLLAFETCWVCYVMGCGFDKRSRTLALL
jgi:hypothetical protein